MEVKCEKCGAIYLVNNGIPKNMRCVCRSKDFKKCK